MNKQNILIEYIRPKEIAHEPEQKTFLFLLILTFIQIVALQSWQMLYTNFVVETLDFTGTEGGIIQSVREIPGLLAVTILIFLRYFKEENFAIVAVFTLGLGVALTGFSQNFQHIILTTLCMSFGFHYFETINQSIILQSFSLNSAPLVFGRLRSISALGSIIVALMILAFAGFFLYWQMYLVCGLVAMVGALFAIPKKPDLSLLPAQKKKLILKKKYWLFYALTFLSGGRRQIFMIFSLFLMVEKFGFTVVMITTLFLINNTINWLLNPLIGRLINRLGEQKLLTYQFISAIFIFLGYAFIDNAYIVGLLYVFDQLTFNFNIAEKTFFQKMGDKEDIAPSMAVAFTINHIAAVCVPTIGGALWLYNYQLPFILGTALACMSLILVQFINRYIK